MLYLIHSPGYGKSGIYKIGFTDDPDIRLRQYLDHNPNTTILGLREGDRALEKCLHLLLEWLGLKYRKLEEWFIESPLVPEVFHWSVHRIHRQVWRARWKILYGGDWKSRDTLRFQIFEDLWRAYTYRRGGALDSWYFSRAYRESTFPDKMVSWFLVRLGEMKNPEDRLFFYRRRIKEWEGNQEFIETLGKKKSPLLTTLRLQDLCPG